MGYFILFMFYFNGHKQKKDNSNRMNMVNVCNALFFAKIQQQQQQKRLSPCWLLVITNQQ